MNMPIQKNTKAFDDKINAYLQTHQRIVTEFESSLENARHFVELANISQGEEPENTVVMLEQIREIDLASHLGLQFDAFEEIVEMLRPVTKVTDNPAGQKEMEGLRLRYQQLLEAAESQQEIIERLLHSLQADG